MQNTIPQPHRLVLPPSIGERSPRCLLGRNRALRPTRATILTAGLVALAVTVGVRASRSSEPPSPNIVLITLDSVRPDHLACYGGERATSPNLDALAEESVLYDDCQSVTSWTLPSHASLFTGLYPTAHQAVRSDSRLDDSYITIAETLSERGYQCAGFASGPFLTRAFHLEQGFEYYDDTPSARTSDLAHEDVTNPEMEESLRKFFRDGRDPGRPLFLFAYFWDPHYDYIPPSPYDSAFVGADCQALDLTNYGTSEVVNPSITREQLNYVISQYDGEILWTDACLGRLFSLLRSQGLWDNTVIMVTADHGEEFFEHGEKGHRHNLHGESIRVPLIVKYPHGEPRGRDSRLVSLVDIVPTLLDLTQAETPDSLDGRSLLTTAPDPDRTVFYELQEYPFADSTLAGATLPELMAPREEVWERHLLLGIREGGYKLITTASQSGPELYDVRSDPSESTNLADQKPAEVRELMSKLTEWHQAMQSVAEIHREAGRTELNEQMRERLRSLGYIR